MKMISNRTKGQKETFSLPSGWIKCTATGNYGDKFNLSIEKGTGSVSERKEFAGLWEEYRVMGLADCSCKEPVNNLPLNNLV